MNCIPDAYASYISEKGAIPYYEWLRTESAGELLTADGRIYSRDSHETGINNNVCVVGGSGTGKSSVIGYMNILRSNASCIISDPKGGLYRDLSGLLAQSGYNVAVLDFTHPERSCGYNPMAYINTRDDARMLADTLISSAYHNSSPSDPYWVMSSKQLLQAMIIYHMKTQLDPAKRSLAAVLGLIKSIRIADDSWDSPQYGFFADLEDYCRRMSDYSAKKEFAAFEGLGEKTFSCIISTATSALEPFCGDGTMAIMSRPTISFRELAHKKTAVFVIVSDTDRSSDLVANTFYWQAMNLLCDHADNQCLNGKLPTPVAFFLDDFSTNCCINNFENIISNIRARNISATIMFQSIGQLENAYGKSAGTILNNCDTTIYMGGNSISDANYFARLVNKPVDRILSMKLFTSWIIRRGEKARLVNNVIPSEWLKAEKSLISESADKLSADNDEIEDIIEDR